MESPTILSQGNFATSTRFALDSMNIFTLFYCLFSFCMIFPIPVFVSCGLTVESLFSRWLGSEHEAFIYYHLRRIVATILVHSSLPLGYVFLRMYLDPDFHVLDSIFWQLILFASLTAVMIAALKMYSWVSNDWELHPVSAKLRVFALGRDLKDLIKDINFDFKSPHKVILQCDPTCKVIGSPNWLMKTSAYNLDIAHQSDVFLQVQSADEHDISTESRGSVQYLKIKVVSARPNVDPFFIRVNSTHLKDLQDMIPTTIRIMENIKVHTTLVDRFLTAFKEQVQLNPTIALSIQIDDECWGCGEKKPDVLLAKTCDDGDELTSCRSCHCRPMWCVDCMGTWFASRQDQDKPELWMSSKCSCPLCRSTFCVLDVCYIERL